MHRTRIGIIAIGIVALCLPVSLQAVTREIADLQAQPITIRQSVISQLSAGILSDPYDEFLRRPYNLMFANIERYPNLSPWPGQEGEQSRYVDFLIGNNGNSNVRAGADTLQGTYIGQGMERIAWGVSAAYLSNDRTTTNSSTDVLFTDGDQLTGFDLRFGIGIEITDSIVLGAGLGAFDRGDEIRDSSFEDGVGGFNSLQEDSSNGFEGDVGLRLFTGEYSSWEFRLAGGSGKTTIDDYSEFLDDAGSVTSRFVVKDYDVSDLYGELSAGYNHRFPEENGEWRARLGVRSSSHEIDNTDLRYSDDGAAVTPELILLDQSPVSETEVFASADTLFLRGWTQIFAGARVSVADVSGSSRSDALGTVVDESVDDSRSQVGLIMGLRQPLWNERFRLIARARADWLNSSRKTTVAGNGTEIERTQTTTNFAIGIETVLNNMVFDLAWLFGAEPDFSAPDGATRQLIALDRLVISATFGW